MKICEYCGTENRDDAVNCSACSANSFNPVCANCGHIIKEGQFCNFCGVKVGAEGTRCPNCDKLFYTNACPTCGYNPLKVNPATGRYCQKCGCMIPANAIWCDRCGFFQTVQTTIKSATDISADKSRIIAGMILCLLFGLFGVHKFYEKKIGMGLLYVFTFGLFGFGPLVDFIVYIVELIRK